MGARTEEAAARAERARAIGLFRYGLIRAAADPGLSTRARGRLVRAVAAAEHTDPTGRQVRVSRDTLDRWIRAWWLCQPELAPGFSCDPAPLVVGGRWGVLLGVGPSRCCGSWVWTWLAAARAVSAICRICWL